MNNFIMDLLSKHEYSVKEKMLFAWEHIQKETAAKSKIDVLQGLMGTEKVSRSANGILHVRTPINVLIHEVGQNLSPEETNENLCVPLTDDNFKLIIKELLFYKVLKEEETANFDIAAYNSILQQVLNSF